MSTTLLALTRLVARDGYGYVTITPSAAGTNTAVTANAAGSHLDPDDDNALYYSAWLKCESDSAGTPLNVGELRRLDKDTGYVASTGVLTVTRAFTNATTTTQGFGIYMALPPTNYGLQKGMTQYINDVLRKLFYHRPVLLTLITDGDMETSGVTNWTASNTTLTKSTTTGITLGKQSLRVLNTSASGYAQSATVNVQPSQTYLVAADLTVVTGTGTLQLWDVTNSAAIDSESCSELVARRVWFSATTPATCKQVAIRLVGTGAADDCYWDNVSLIRNGATEFSLPSWFTNKKWMEYAKFWHARSSSSSGNDRALDSVDREPTIWFDVLEDKGGLTPYKLVLDQYVPTGALLVAQSLSPYTELSADTDSTEANADLVKAWALFAICQDQGDKDKAAKWLAEAQALDKQYQARWEGKRFALRGLHG